MFPISTSSTTQHTHTRKQRFYVLRAGEQDIYGISAEGLSDAIRTLRRHLDTSEVNITLSFAVDSPATVPADEVSGLPVVKL